MAKRETEVLDLGVASKKPSKLQITLRVDSDVIAWFRANHPRYQTLMNAVLRKEMVQAIAEEERERSVQQNGH